MSTGSILLAAAWAACGGACGGGGTGQAPTGAHLLRADPAMIQVSPGATGSARFVLTGGGVPVAGQDVVFSIVDNEDTPFIDAQGAVLAASSAVTDANGVATVEIRVDLPTVFGVRATAGSAEAELSVIVAVGTGSVQVVPSFAPDSTERPGALTIDVLLLDDERCADVDLFRPPYPLRGATGMKSLPASGGTVRFDNVSTAQSSAIVAQALDARVRPIAVGCIDLPGSSLVVGGVVEVSLALHDAVPSPIGRFNLTSSFDFKPPLDAAAVVAGPWRDLGDCPLDPAQRLLDCIIDALSPATTDDPLDCRPNTSAGGASNEGPLGNALAARRGTLIADPLGGVTACRGATFDSSGAPSLDALAMGLFGSPTPPLLIALPQIGEDAARALASVTLQSTLDVQSSGRADEYVVTHTLDAARFDSSVMSDAEVKLQPLALPAVTAYTTATTRDRLLVVANHGFSLRLGRVARAGFGAAALEPRDVAPPDVAGLISALVALARSSDGAVGCAAFDRALCAAAGGPAGCLATACPAGRDALATQLSAVFDAADGSGLDLYLAGSAPLIDTRGVGYARQLGSPVGDPTAMATWSVDLRTASGRARQLTSFVGVRAEP